MTRDGNSATRYTTAFLIGLFFADGPDNTETDKWQQVYKQLPTLMPSPPHGIADDDAVQIHKIGGDLKIPAKEGLVRADPPYILEEQHEKSHEKGMAALKDKVKWSGSFMDVQCSIMSCDHLAFSKSIIRRFIRDCVDRDAAVASPWTVKPVIAKHYGVDSIWEDKEGPPTKKQKKMTAAQEERVLAVAAEKREREAREKAERQQKAKQEAERLAAEKKKKKPIHYPTEDLDVRLNDKEKKVGLKVKKPTPSKLGLPFGENQGTFEAFLTAWNFLAIYGQPLHLSTFTMYEFEHALRHSLVDPPCALLGEIHSTLIYNLRTVPFTRHSAVLLLLRIQDTPEGDYRVLGVSIDELAGAMADIGNNWEWIPLWHNEMRDGWEEALLGCLKDHATLDNFPRLREILTRLFFAPELHAEALSSSSSSRVSSPAANILSVHSSPSERYYVLRSLWRTAVFPFNEMNSLAGEMEVKELGTNSVVPDEDTTMHESSDLSDVPSEDGSETASTSSARQKRSARQKDLRQKAHPQAHAKQRELARAQAASAKQALAEHRRLDEEVNKLERQLEVIEREFRKLLGAVRVKPLGKDRFHNQIWWFDGMGSASLLGSGGVVQYEAGRIFIQGPSVMDLELMLKKEDDDYEAKRLEEEGPEGMLAPSEWAQYAEPEELDEFLAWLNHKGVRELALKNSFIKWWNHIAPGMRKHFSDLNTSAKLPEARRSTQTKSSGHNVSREPYMM
ncbi:chromatin remodeling complex protein [Suillus bovinus]|uniref:chromatin remodeling complex protein n=1 Tax=Suillus bovinus TaxID=48563 RepID=UPI001B863CCE|nr:chromatin remodeling complex protein [Suillus bovinus]KAG2125775.1 chromatin remodeling complex protein [Suillus bovinus]